jgi:hypothetical protein
MPQKDPLTAIHEIEQLLTSSELLSDEKALRELLSNDFLGVNMRGQRIDKDAFIAGLCSSGVKFDSLKIEDLEVRFHRDSAVAIGKSVFAARVQNQSISGKAQFMDIWVNTGERWMLKASSVTPIKS